MCLSTVRHWFQKRKLKEKLIFFRSLLQTAKAIFNELQVSRNSTIRVYALAQGTRTSFDASLTLRNNLVSSRRFRTYLSIYTRVDRDDFRRDMATDQDQVIIDERLAEVRRILGNQQPVNPRITRSRLVTAIRFMNRQLGFHEDEGIWNHPIQRWPCSLV